MPANRWRGLLGALCVIATLGGAQADEISRYETSASGGSERLRLFALTRIFDRYAYDPQVRYALREELTRQGHFYDGSGSRVLRQEVWAAPLVEYNQNLNGGVLNDRFRFGGLVFEADPQIRAKSGWLTGARVGTFTRVALSDDTLLDLVGAAELGYAPAHDISRTSAQVQACLRHSLTGWNFVDLCQGMAQTRWDLGRSKTRSTRIRLSTLRQISDTYHEAWIEAEHTKTNATSQNAMTIGLRSIFDGLAPYGSISVGADVEGEIAPKLRLNAGVEFPKGGRIFEAFVWAQRAEGSRFLGTDRQDETYGAGLSAELARGQSVEVSYSENHSNIAFFDYSQVELKFRFRDIRW